MLVLILTIYCLVYIVLVAQAKVCSLNEIEIFEYYYLQIVNFK